MPGLEERVRTSAHDRAVLRRLPGKKVILTNAPRAPSDSTDRAPNEKDRL